jgi:hypothetical protein
MPELLYEHFVAEIETAQIKKNHNKIVKKKYI